MEKHFGKRKKIFIMRSLGYVMGLFLLSFSFSHPYIHPQPSRYKFEHITPRDGLSQSTVEAILQDKKGFLWFGTNDGLNKYDGYTITVYRYSTLSPTSISDNYIYDLIEDSEGFIWIGTSDGLNKYDPDKNVFEHFIRNDEDTSSITDNFVHHIFEDSIGNLWIATMGGGLNLFKRDSETFLKVPVASKSFGKDIQKITSLFISNDNKLFVGAYSGEIFFCDLNNYYKNYSAGSNNFLDYINFQKITSSQYQNKSTENIIWAFMEDNAGNIWIGTSKEGLIKYDKARKSIDKIDLNTNNRRRNEKLSILSLLNDPSGKIWIGTGGEGIIIYDPITEETENIQSNALDIDGLNDNSVWSLLRDRSGNYWVGTEFGGVNKFSPARLKFDQLALPSSKLGIKNNFQIWAIYVDEDSIIWLGTELNGLMKYDQKNNVIEQFKHNVWDDNSIGHNTVTAIECGPHGNLWIGTNGAGLYKFIPWMKKFVRFNNEADNINSISNNVIKDVCFDKKGDLWISTYGGGINKLIPETGNIERVTFNDKKLNDGQFDFFSTLFISSDSILWAGTYGSGLLKVNIRTKDAKLFEHNRGDIKSINNNRIVSIAEDEDGSLWIGTAVGINRYSPADDSFEHYGVDEGLANGVIYAILNDGKGNLWMSTNKGISKFNRRRKSFTNFTEEDGLQSYEFNRGAAFKIDDGRMYFGGINGANVFHPDSIEFEITVPPIVITKIEVMNSTINHEQLIKEYGTLILPYDKKVISFEFAVLDYKAPLKNQYAYYLENFDDDWNISGTQRLATYTNLSPGSYIFHVKGTNSDGIWSESEAAVLLIIEPPYYRTWWAYTIYILAFLALLYYIRLLDQKKRKRLEEERLRQAKEKANLREAQLRAEMAESKTKAVEIEKELEKEQMRARIASDLHDEIGSNLSSITLISEMIGNRDDINSEIQKAIKNIKHTSRLSTQRIRDIIWLINPMSDKLGELARRMQKITSVLSGKININFTCNGLDEEKSINPEVKRNVYLIFREAVNNIVKHSNAGIVDIDFYVETGYLKMVVKDDGSGFDINSVIGGNGIANMKHRANELNADFIIESEPRNGTAIKLLLKIT